jgi:hypothetical protein
MNTKIPQVVFIFWTLGILPQVMSTGDPLMRGEGHLDFLCPCDLQLLRSWIWRLLLLPDRRSEGVLPQDDEGVQGPLYHLQTKTLTVATF